MAKAPVEPAANLRFAASPTRLLLPVPSRVLSFMPYHHFGRAAFPLHRQPFRLHSLRGMRRRTQKRARNIERVLFVNISWCGPGYVTTSSNEKRPELQNAFATHLTGPLARHCLTHRVTCDRLGFFRWGRGVWALCTVYHHHWKLSKIPQKQTFFIFPQYYHSE